MCTLFFQKVCFLLQILLLCIICGTYQYICNKDKCCVVTQRTADIFCITWLAYLACLHSHVLFAYDNFESKQVNSITLFGRCPNNKLIFPTLTIPFLFRWSQRPKCHCILDLKLPNGRMQEYFPLFLPFFTFPPWSSPLNHFLDSPNPCQFHQPRW